MVSAIPMQSATLHRFHSTTIRLHPMASPLASSPTQTIHRPEPTGILSSRKARELGTLRPALDQPLLFNPGPLSVSQRGRNPYRRSDQNSCLTLRPTKSARRFALSSEIAAFQVLVACRPSRLTRRQTFTLDIDTVTFRLVVRTRLQDLALPPFQTKIAFSRDYRQVQVRNTPPSLVRPSPSSCKPPSRHALA